ncbi:MAG: extracellular solute-binding protein [Oscillospiraceae bacterium]|nr:extracellular solute-binding protein [Oscillospiraceae bacterium]
MKAEKNIAFALICVGIFALTGCSAESGRTSSTSETMTYSDEESSAVSAFEIPNETPNSETPYITYLGTRELGAVALETYAKTAGLSSAESAVTVVYTGENTYESRLTELISADESPDLTEKRANTFPTLMSRNVYEDLTPFMDVAAPQWEGLTECIERYSFKGAHYFYPTKITVSPQFLLYDKLRYVQFNIPDPEKLWERNEWTWENMVSGADVLRENLDIPDYIYGDNIPDNFLASTGTAFITADESGKFVHRFHSAGFDEIVELFGTHNCSITEYDDVSTTNCLESLRAVFMSADERALGELRRTSPELNIGIVPYPWADNADEYYVKAVTDGYLVPKGAKNIRSAASFINCSRIAEVSDDRQKALHRELKTMGLLVSDIEWIDILRTDCRATSVLVEENSLGSAANESVNYILESSLWLGNPMIDRPDVKFGSTDFDIASIDADLERINSMI